MTLEEKRKRNRDYMRDWYRRNRKKSIAWALRWKRNNPERTRETQRRYAARHSAAICKRNKRYITERLKTDVGFLMRKRLSQRISIAVKKGQTRKISGTTVLLGCSIPSFKLYLESKFEIGMTWANYGHSGWEIDHIIPCALFDLTKPEHQKACFHFSNLQPMWSIPNRSKGAKYESEQLSPEIARLVNC